MLVKSVDLLTLLAFLSLGGEIVDSKFTLFQQGRRCLLFSSKDDALGGEDTNSGTSLVDGFHGVLDLFETA